MSPDVEITRDSELMVAGIVGNTEAGIEFVDAWTPRSPAVEFVVVDSGHIIVPEAEIESVVASAAERGLSVERSSR